MKQLNRINMSFVGFWMVLSLKFVNKVQFSPLTSEPLDDI